MGANGFSQLNRNAYTLQNLDLLNNLLLGKPMTLSKNWQARQLA